MWICTDRNLFFMKDSVIKKVYHFPILYFKLKALFSHVYSKKYKIHSRELHIHKIHKYIKYTNPFEVKLWFDNIQTHAIYVILIFFPKKFGIQKTSEPERIAAFILMFSGFLFSPWRQNIYFIFYWSMRFFKIKYIWHITLC